MRFSEKTDPRSPKMLNFSLLGRLSESSQQWQGVKHRDGHSECMLGAPKTDMQLPHATMLRLSLQLVREEARVD